MIYDVDFNLYISHFINTINTEYKNRKVTVITLDDNESNPEDVREPA